MPVAQVPNARVRCISLPQLPLPQSSGLINGTCPEPCAATGCVQTTSCLRLWAGGTVLLCGLCTDAAAHSALPPAHFLCLQVILQVTANVLIKNLVMHYPEHCNAYIRPLVRCLLGGCNSSLKEVAPHVRRHVYTVKSASSKSLAFRSTRGEWYC